MQTGCKMLGPCLAEPPSAAPEAQACGALMSTVLKGGSHEASVLTLPSHVS